MRVASFMRRMRGRRGSRRPVPWRQRRIAVLHQLQRAIHLGANPPRKAMSTNTKTPSLEIIADDAATALPKLIPECEIHAAFLRRSDIASLPEAEQAARWERQKRGIARFNEALSGVPVYAMR